jgi:hypothetical protein
MLLKNGSNCPYRGINPPISAKLFCKDGCSTICKEQMIEKLTKTAKGRRWLEWDVNDSEGD